MELLAILGKRKGGGKEKVRGGRGGGVWGWGGGEDRGQEGGEVLGGEGGRGGGVGTKLFEIISLRSDLKMREM